MMISNTVNPKGMSQSCMRHVTVLLVFSLKFTHIKMKGPNKSIQPQPQKINLKKPVKFFPKIFPSNLLAKFCRLNLVAQNLGAKILHIRYMFRPEQDGAYTKLKQD